MRISPDFLAALREKVPLSEIVGRFVSWDRRKSQPGKGDLWACCPFHEEKTPSFHVDDTKGFYHCFGCQQSGDHVRFLMDHQGLAFPEAVRVIADAAGMAVPQAERAETERAGRARRQRGALEVAASTYGDTLTGPAGQSAREYAQSRGFTQATLIAFEFGLAPNLHGFLMRQLQAEGVSEGDAQKAGLSVRTDNGELRDRFRGRLMIPIHDERGRLVGFGGRSLDGREPKYLNSPETELFDKSSLLFNAHRARGVAHRANRLFVVEGYLDAIALWQAGLECVVASLGTALTEAQIKRAWALADEPILCFDGDTAGQNAAQRALDRIVPLLSAGKSFQFLTLPDGQDPDDIVHEGGLAAFEGLAARASPLVDVLFAREASRGTDTPERLAALEARVDAVSASIPDQRVSSNYRAALRDRLFALRRTKTQGHTHARTPSAKPAAPSAPNPRVPAGPKDALVELERIVLGLLIRNPLLVERYGERVGATHFANAAHQGLAAMILEAQSEHLCAISEELLAVLPDRARMCTQEVWGDLNDTAGTRLTQRFQVLTCDPDDAFVGDCVDVFLTRLSLREEIAELTLALQEGARGDAAAEQRLLSLSAAVEEQRASLLEAELRLADRAAELRKRKAQDADGQPSDQLL